jgi:hypothetical protein
LTDEVSVLFGIREPGEDDPAFRLAQMHRDLTRAFGELALRGIRKWAGEQNRHELRLGEYQAGYQPEPYEVRFLKLDESEELSALFRSLPGPGEASVFNPREDSVDDVRFFVVAAKDQHGHGLACFRTVTKSRKLVGTGKIVAHLVGTRFERTEEVSLVFDWEFQVIAYRGYLFIFQQQGFETLFQFYDELRTVADKALNKVGKAVPIANFDAFREDILGHLIKVKKLLKISRSPYLTHLDMDKIRVTIKDYGSTVQITDDEDGKKKLVYDPSDPWALLELLEDQYVKSSMTDRKYAANSKREITPKGG